MRGSGKNFFIKIVAALLLLVICVGGTELLFFHAAEPEAFETAIVQPARTLSRRIEDNFQQAETSLEDLVAEAASNISDVAGAIAANVSDISSDMAGRVRAYVENLTAPTAPSAPAVPEDFPRFHQAVTEFFHQGDREYLSGGTAPLPYYNQGDTLWAERCYGGDPIGQYGCGPTALAMAVSYLTGTDVNPVQMAAWAASAGFAVPQSGSRLGIVAAAADRYGLDCISLPAADAAGVETALSSGGIVVALMGPGHFTTGGHFIILHGLTPAGDILVADPNSRENSLTPWPLAVILAELSSSRADGAPLWRLQAFTGTAAAVEGA